MTTDNSASTTTPAKSGLPSWAKKAIGIAVLLVVLVIAYFILAAYLPRAWAQNVGGMAGGSFAGGILWGLLFGTVCTLLPLLLFRWAWHLFRRRRFKPMQIVLLIVGVLVVLPNLLTLSVVLGGNSAAHAGERVMDVDAPGFRGASLAGAIIGVVLFLGIAGVSFTYRKRGEDLAEMRRDAKSKDLQSGSDGPPAGPSPAAP
ncbi:MULTISPECIES: hypothetical protein [unclassified Rhodococcus (in: high G+C Gram-positive bacteria)]|uniref:hypothetical protein n=1 Tax=unclassified Rhodococcus (in: high G+C Gram-positive bacteria) TaxID=192944 RepID=UPI001639F6FC|nr:MULTISPECIES: hypothetical protein [unclassified Rhodococcus (in: high G+C Gram-positive bacteria)]MBC2639836.1 hypothetical protein [Rhodococcus sp. 3A]MBC2895418.1 hypothetical protein [Rhodococcus sp. 4CII]